ncbi:MAG: S1 RNA-binding domain-containing protein [Streptococcaceae bacterium]|jgi:general stress protein 13|nr:S1 RNA-binding domain-containing protein [Streptococcaceae bacterium]
MMTEQAIKTGDILTVEVTGLQKYGAFVKFGKRRGLIHISEIKSGYVPDIREVIQVGQICQAQVIDIDAYNDKVSLSLRALEKAPQTHHIQRRYHFNNPTNKIGFQPFNDLLEDWTKDQLTYLKQLKHKTQA